jgi:hypothetical protein
MSRHGRSHNSCQTFLIFRPFSKPSIASDVHRELPTPELEAILTSSAYRTAFPCQRLQTRAFPAIQAVAKNRSCISVLPQCNVPMFIYSGFFYCRGGSINNHIRGPKALPFSQPRATPWGMRGGEIHSAQRVNRSPRQTIGPLGRNTVPFVSLFPRALSWAGRMNAPLGQSEITKSTGTAVMVAE